MTEKSIWHIVKEQIQFLLGHVSVQTTEGAEVWDQFFPDSGRMTGNPEIIPLCLQSPALRQVRLNCWASSGPSGARLKQPSGSG
jgi:hypothetical protein